MVVGDLIGSGAAEERNVVGETPNLAARPQAVAQPDTIVIDAQTRRLVAALFEYRDLGMMEAKGFAAPVQAFQVLRPSGHESRFEAMRSERLTPLIGRDDDLDLLLRRWRTAKEGEGQVVLLGGEPGIGKSRLIQALTDRLGAEQHTGLCYFCSAHHRDSALYPVIAQLERAADLRREDTPEARLAKLEALLAQGSNTWREDLPLIAGLMAIPTGGRYPVLELSPQKRRERTLNALLAQLAGLAARQPLFMLFEDVHWADPTTLDILDLTIERAMALPVLVIVSFRPEFVPPWVGRSQVSLMTLNRLAPRQRAAMIGGVTGGKLLPKEIEDQIIARTDGIPLFVEELTKTIMESGLLTDAGDRYELNGPLPALAIPTPTTASSTPWSRTRPTTRSSKAGARCSTVASPRCWRNDSPSSSRPSPSALRITAPRPASRKRPSATG